MAAGSLSPVPVLVLGSPLTAASLSEVSAVLGAEGAEIAGASTGAAALDGAAVVDDDPTVVELSVAGVEASRIRAALGTLTPAAGTAVCVLPPSYAREGRRLVVTDVDSTLIRDEVIELLAAHAGREREVAAATEAAMRGDIDFAESLRTRCAALAGLPATVFDEVRAAVRLTPGARRLVTAALAAGHSFALVSGGFEEIVRPLADDLGIVHVRANRLEVEDGRLTGRVVGDIVDRESKARALREFAAVEGVPLERVVAVGDGANDLDMMAAAGLGIAFDAKPMVREQADVSLPGPRLDAVLALL